MNTDVTTFTLTSAASRLSSVSSRKPQLDEKAQKLFDSYRTILEHDPTKGHAYKDMAKLLPTPAEQSHLLLKGAWAMLANKEYALAQELAQAAHKAHGAFFDDYLLDLELLRAQKKQALLPQKLLEIAQLFQQKKLPAQELKAYKLLAELDPKPAYSQKIIALYTQTGKPQKAASWKVILEKQNPPKQIPPAPAPPPQTIFREPTETKQPLKLPTRPLASPQPTPLTAPLKPDPDRPVSQRPTETKEQPAPASAPIRSLAIQKLPEMAFGKAAWEEHFGVDVGEEPPLPADIEEILNSSFPIFGGFFNRKKVKDTHLLTLIPATVNGKPLTLALMGELVQKPLKGNATKYSYLNLGQTKDVAAPKAHWVLVTKDVLEGSRKKPYGEQAALVAEHAKKSKLPYTVPKVLDVAVSLFVEYVKTGTCLYGRDPWTYTRCHEKYDGSCQVFVGSFAPWGLYVGDDWGSDDNGVGASREF